VHYQVGDYRRLFYTGDVHSYQELYFEHLALSAESGLFDTLAHPDLIKNESPADWDFKRIRPHLERALDRIAETGVAMELNTSGVLKALPQMNPSPAQLSLMRERGIPVVIGADAHVPERVGDGYPEALRLLRQAGYGEVSYFLDRKRHTVPVDAALRQLEEVAVPS
jgi:histidinol-phosphatase (PHP family)